MFTSFYFLPTKRPTAPPAFTECLGLSLPKPLLEPPPYCPYEGPPQETAADERYVEAWAAASRSAPNHSEAFAKAANAWVRAGGKVDIFGVPRGALPLHAPAQPKLVPPSDRRPWRGGKLTKTQSSAMRLIALPPQTTLDTTIP